MKITRGTDSVFRDIGFDKAEPENLKLRSALMIRIVKLLRELEMTHSDAASVFGVTQPRLNQLLKGKI